MAETVKTIDKTVMKGFSTVGKLVVLALPVVAGIYFTRFLDRKVFKNKVPTISE